MQPRHLRSQIGEIVSNHRHIKNYRKVKIQKNGSDVLIEGTVIPSAAQKLYDARDSKTGLPIFPHPFGEVVMGNMDTYVKDVNTGVRMPFCPAIPHVEYMLNKLELRKTDG